MSTLWRSLIRNRWDSSDPERAPPPLPLNPQSPVVVSRAGTSSAIQSAHAALTEKAREAAMVPHPLVKRSKPETSPERSLLRGSTHRRMASVKDLSLMIEGGADSPSSAPRSVSPDKTERPTTPSARPRDSFFDLKMDKDLRPAPLSSSPMPGPSLTPILRPAARRAPQSILGENNSPQSATMLALQSMGPHPPKPLPETPLANITNGSTAAAKVPGSLDSLSNQILTLTSIATTLQKEMSQLSRRSRDNATDLLSLKEATNARDEDIRRSLRELITDAQTKTGKTRDACGGPLLLEGGDGGDGGSGGSRGRARGWSFSDDGEGSHSGHSGSSVSESRTGPDRRHSAPVTRAEDILGEDVLKTIRTIKDSVTQSGGLTAEVKALVRELRGEVLGMGREIGRRLDEVNAKHVTNGKTNHASKAEMTHASKAEMTRIIDEGLDQMKQQMDNLLREHRRQSGATSVAAEPLVDYDEVYKTVREALRDSQAHKPEFGKEDVIRAVREAWEECLPDVKSQHTGLERDDVFKCLQEGLQAYAPRSDRESAATREEVFQAVVEGLKHYVPPRLETADTLSRDQIVDAVRDCLEEFEFPVAPSAMGHELSRSDVVDAIREGLDEFEFPIAPSALSQELSRNDVVEAVKEGLHSFEFPIPPLAARSHPEVTQGDLLDAVNVGLQSFDFSNIQSSALVQPSLTKADVTEAVKQGLGSFNTRDISDAVKDGVFSMDLPTDVSRAVSAALGSFDFASVYSAALVPRSELPNSDVADAIKQGLDALDLSDDVARAVKEALRSFDFAAAYSSTLPPSSDVLRVDVIDAVKQGLQTLDLKDDMARAVEAGLRAFEFPTCAASAASSALIPASSDRGIPVSSDSGSIGTTAKDTTESETSAKGLDDLKLYLEEQFQAVSDEAKQNLSTNSQDTCLIMDATKDGFERLRQEVETYVGRAMGDADPGETMAHLVRTLEGFRDEVADLIAKSTESSRDMLRDEVASLREAVNSSLVPALPHPSANSGGSKEFIDALHEGISTLRTDISTRPLAGVSEIIDALQEGLGDIRFSIDKLQDKPVDLTANDEILDALREGLDGVRADIDVLREETKTDRSLATLSETTNAQAVVQAQQPSLKPEDIQKLESLLAQLGSKVESLESAPPPVVESVSKEDLAHIHEKLQTVADGVAQMPHLDSLGALAALEERVKIMQDSITELISREPVVAAMAVPAAAPAAPAAPPAPTRATTDAATKEDVEAIETILRNTKARLDDLIDGEQAVNKVHIDLLESNLLETRDMLSTLALSIDLLSRKEDVTMVESLVTQIIGSFDDMKERHEKALEDPEKVTKTDVDAVEAICLDTKVVIEQMLKTDLTTLASKEDLVQLQSLLKEYQGQVATRAETDTKALAVQQIEMASVGDRVVEVKTVLEEFQDIMRGKLEDGAKGIDAINGLLDAMNTTIRKNANISEDVKEMFDTMKLEFEDSRAGVVGAKMESDERFQATALLLTTKLDERMAELFQKYDEFQLLQDERVAKGEARDADMEAAVVGSKAIAEELRSLIDTLGATVTDSLEKMEEASRTVFERVEDLVNKSEESYTDGKAEHQLTREQFQEVIGKVDGLQGHVVESEPKVLEAIQDVMLLVNQHYEHTKTSALAIDEKMEEAKLQVLALPPPPEKYDDTVVREKLDQLVEQATSASTTLEQLGVLPNVYAQVKQTAAELAAFIAAQTQRIADEHEDKEKTLQETIVALERRLEEKKQVENYLATLREDEARLKESITVTLRSEQEQMKQQFLMNLVEEEERLKSANIALREEHENLKTLFVGNLQEEQSRMMEMNVALKEEQEQIKETFLLGLKEEQARLTEMNVAIKEEQDKLKESFLVSLREEQAHLKEMNDALREEHRALKDTLLANLREEESLLKEVNGNLREEQEELRKLFVANIQEEAQRLREANENLRLELKQEQEDLKATFKEDNERFKIELLANLMEEESRLKDLNESLRADHIRMRDEFFAAFNEEEQRLKAEMQQLRAERDDLAAQKTRTLADLSATETALEIRRDNVQYMEAKAEGLERRILEGVVEHSKVLLMSRPRTSAAPSVAGGSGGRESMSRKRVSSVKITATAATPPKPRAVPATKNAKINSPATTTTPVGSRRILSLSQMNNNVPTGGLARSQSVKTPAGRPRKASWTPGGGGAKGYGDLSSDRNKENKQDLREEADEDVVIPVPVPEVQNPPPVDIQISSPASSVHGDGEPTPHEEELDAEYDAISLDGDREAEAETEEGVRRASRGTRVVTTPMDEEEELGGDGEGIVYSDPEDEDVDVDVDDAASDWTDSAMRQETVVGTEDPWEKKGY